MDEIIEKFDKLNTKCSNIDKYMTILSNGVSSDSKKINADISEINALNEKILKISKDQMKFEYNSTMKNMQKTQLKMLFIMEKLAAIESKVNLDRRALQTLTPARKLENNEAFSTGKMSLKDYLKSPLICKTKPVALHFFDFEAEVTKEDFSKIPSYMKNRTAVEELQEFLENVVIKCFNDKYTLFYKKRDAVSNPDRNLWIAFHEQKSYFNGEKFITQGDICRTIDRMVDKKIENKLQMLRHLQIIKEVRRNGTICYMWIKKT